MKFIYMKFIYRYFKKMLSERTVNDSCRTEITRPKGTKVFIFGMQKNEFFAWRKTDTVVRTTN